MEEKIFSKLQAGLKNSSLSERTIRAFAKRMALKVTEESQITDELITEGVEILTEMNGQLSKDVAEIVKKQTEKPIVPPTPPPAPPKTDSNETTAQVIARLAEIENKLLQSEKQNKLLRIKEEAVKRLKEKGNIKDYILTNALGKVELADDDTADTLAEKIIPIYDKEFKLAYGEGSVPRVGDETQSREQANARLTEFKEKMEKKKK